MIRPEDYKARSCRQASDSTESLRNRLSSMFRGKYLRNPESDILRLCVCGPWLFTEFSFPPTQEATVKDNRGGFRPGAGRKSKNACLWSTQTAPIRVPAWQKDSIKGFIDWLIEKESDCESVHELLWHATLNSERIAEELSREGLHQQAQKESKKAVLFHELYEKLPRFDVKHHKVPAVLKNDAANRQIIDLVNSEEEDPRQMHIDFDE